MLGVSASGHRERRGGRSHEPAPSRVLAAVADGQKLPLLVACWGASAHPCSNFAAWRCGVSPSDSARAQPGSLRPVPLRSSVRWHRRWGPAPCWSARCCCQLSETEWSGSSSLARNGGLVDAHGRSCRRCSHPGRLATTRSRSLEGNRDGWALARPQRPCRRGPIRPRSSLSLP